MNHEEIAKNEDDIILEFAIEVERKRQLINSIINTNFNKYINYEHPYQIKKLINHLNYKVPQNNNDIEIKDPFYYINEINKPKKIINFIISKPITGKIVNERVKVPNLISKTDLYTIAYGLYSYKTELLLIHNNNILEKDETNINLINNNDYIFVISNYPYCDSSYSQFLMQNISENEVTINFNFRYGMKMTLFFPCDIKLKAMKEAVNLNAGLNEKYFKIIYNAKSIDLLENEEKKIYEYFKNKIASCNIYTYENWSTGLYGKIIMGNTKNSSFKVGLLNSTKIFYSIFTYLNDFDVKFYFNNKEILEEKSLLSLGLKDNFFAKIEEVKDKEYRIIFHNS
jgi:hypothetical protein